MGVPGYKTRVILGGTPTTFTSEATTQSSATYQISDATKRVWDRETAITVLEGGSTFASSRVSNIDYLFGKVTLTSPSSLAITVTGKYIPVSSGERIANCNNHTVNLESTLLDHTNYLDAQDSSGTRKYLIGLLDSNATISGFDRMSSDIRSAFENREPILLEVIPGNSSNIFRGWYVVETDSLSGNVDDLESEEISLQVDEDRQGLHGIGMGFNI